jgi:hypothetical protein
MSGRNDPPRHSLVRVALSAIVITYRAGVKVRPTLGTVCPGIRAQGATFMLHAAFALTLISAGPFSSAT